ncbi:glycosyltransferase family 2 protein [Candidatus Uhrbacteria bacterium]|nr:glycosyltransferase family 2 protein [Candidatus Uhrbacteria bacterium]
MNSRPPVAAIVAAYNEEPTIGPIVATLVESRLFRDVIVVSDGSVDRTVDRARAAGASVVHQFPVNRGKGKAIMHGVSHTDAPILFFCDADLHGLTVEHLKALIQPVLEGEVAMNVGLRDRGKFIMKLSKYLPLIGGERALPRKLFESIPEKYLSGFMLETALNYVCRARRMKISTTELPGLTIRRKMQKVGFWRGLGQYIKMTGEMWRAAAIIRIGHLKGEL